VKLSLCNEVVRELPFERQCALAAGLGYRGLELAPFTFGDDAWRMPAVKRAEIRRACADSGIEVSGLHWLLAAPAGLSITTPDRSVWQKSVDVLRASVDLCAELGGIYLVHGSPAQRRVEASSDTGRAEEAWAIAAAAAQTAGVIYCLEALSMPECIRVCWKRPSKGCFRLEGPRLLSARSPEGGASQKDRQIDPLRKEPVIWANFGNH
jgi:sugar phosphate isomerase/epimerase